MLSRGSGTIVNVASVVGMIALGGRSPYAASKAAVLHLTRNLAVEYGEHGIRANALCPGWTRTPMMSWRLEEAAFRERVRATVPLGRVAEPDEQARACLFSRIVGVELPQRPRARRRRRLEHRVTNHRGPALRLHKQPVGGS